MSKLFFESLPGWLVRRAFTRFQASPALPFLQLNRQSVCACAKRVVAMNDVYEQGFSSLRVSSKSFFSYGDGKIKNAFETPTCKSRKAVKRLFPCF